MTQNSAQDAETLAHRATLREARFKRLSDLEKFLARSNKLTTEEYLELLYEAQKNILVLMTMSTVKGNMEGTVAGGQVLERIHYLIDSAESKHQRETSLTTGAVRKELTWVYPKTEQGEPQPEIFAKA